jgi:hypothetical protein
MSATQRMKARTKVLLNQSTTEDTGNQRDSQWTRFIFSQVLHNGPDQAC